MSKDFFISYNRADREWSEWIAWQLEAAGYTTVLQAWDFRPGGNFVSDMHRAIQVTERTIMVLSQDYLDSAFTKPEWSEAFAGDPTGEQGLLVPVRVGACGTNGLMRAMTYIDLLDVENEEEARDVLLKGVSRERSKPAEPPTFPGRPHPRYPGITSSRKGSGESVGEPACDSELGNLTRKKVGLDSMGVDQDQRKPSVLSTPLHSESSEGRRATGIPTFHVDPLENEGISKLFGVAGKFAGVAGIALVVLLVLYSQLLSSGLLSRVTGQSNAYILGGVVFAISLLVLVSLFVWFLKDAEPSVRARSFLALVFMVLAFATAVFLISKSTPKTPVVKPVVKSALDDAVDDLSAGRLSQAEANILKAIEAAPDSADVWSVGSEISLRKHMVSQAMDRAKRALAIDKDHYGGILWLILAQLVEGGEANRHKAMLLLQAGQANSSDFTAIGDCLRRVRAFEKLLVTLTEISIACDVPAQTLGGRRL